MRSINRIVIHHSLTADSGTVSWDAIRKYHVDVNGWSDIGYHYGVELVGSRYEVFVGRPLRKQGSHAVGANRDSVGICLVGNFTLAAPPQPMMQLAAELCADICSVFGFPAGKIFGHRDVSDNRACPGGAFPLEYLRSLVREKLR